MRGGVDTGSVDKPRRKRGKSREGRLEGWRAKGPGQFNGPFVDTVRPPALTGCHTHKHAHTRTHTQPLCLLISTSLPPSPHSIALPCTYKFRDSFQLKSKLNRKTSDEYFNGDIRAPACLVFILRMPFKFPAYTKACCAPCKILP